MNKSFSPKAVHNCTFSPLVRPKININILKISEMKKVCHTTFKLNFFGYVEKNPVLKVKNKKTF